MNTNRLPLRRHRRRQTLVLLEMESLDDTEKKARVALINISAGGAAVECPIEFNQEEEVVLKFIFPGRRVYFVEGMIRRSNRKSAGYIYGIEFVSAGFWESIKRRRVFSKLSGRY